MICRQMLCHLLRLIPLQSAGFEGRTNFCRCNRGEPLQSRHHTVRSVAGGLARLSQPQLDRKQVTFVVIPIRRCGQAGGGVPDELRFLFRGDTILVRSGGFQAGGCPAVEKLPTGPVTATLPQAPHPRSVRSRACCVPTATAEPQSGPRHRKFLAVSKHRPNPDCRSEEPRSNMRALVRPRKSGS